MNDITRTQSNGIHPAVHDHFSRMSEVLHERDELLKLSTKQAGQLQGTEKNNIFLQEQLDKVTRERDYHMRLNYELTSRMNSIRGIMDNMFELADHAAVNAKLPIAAQIEEAKE